MTRYKFALPIVGIGLILMTFVIFVLLSDFEPWQQVAVALVGLATGSIFTGVGFGKMRQSVRGKVIASILLSLGIAAVSLFVLILVDFTDVGDPGVY